MTALIPDLIISDDVTMVLHNAFVDARTRGLRSIDVDQMLVALLEAAPTRELICACVPGADTAALCAELRAVITERAAAESARRESRSGMVFRIASRLQAMAPARTPQPSKQFEETVTRGIMHVMTLRLFQLNCKDLLLSILGDAQSPAAVALGRYGITRYVLVCYLAHGARDDKHDAVQVLADEAGRVRLILLNDDFTPMPFVVHVAGSVFGMASEQAEVLMKSVHHDGRGDCGLFPFDIAMGKLRQIEALAIEQQHPLKAILEPA